MFSSRPPNINGLSIGLLGGSFNPPHAGHALITKIALARLRLDRVWWMFSPGNPLKSDAPAKLEMRVNAAQTVMSDPRLVFTDIESQLDTRYTIDTIKALQARYRGTRFVWLMGEDNLAQFHRWEDGKSIAAAIPIAVFSRPGAGFPALNSRMARTFAHHRLPASKARALPLTRPPAWTLLELSLIHI